MTKQRKKNIFLRFVRDDGAVAAVEAGFIFPLLLLIMCGMIDVGAGLVAKQKMIASCQTVADLLARETQITDGILQDAVTAGRLSLLPYDTQSFGVHVAGIEYSGNNGSPVLRWQDTVNIAANTQVVAGSSGLGDLNEGVLAVTTRYRFRPFFSFVFTGPVTLQEVAYVRGRRGVFIPRVRG